MRLCWGHCYSGRVHKEETGSPCNPNSTTQSLFKVMVKKAIPKEVQKRLDNVVGLMKIEWLLFTEHLVHHVEATRKEKRNAEETSKHLANRLTQMQVNDMSTKSKKNKVQAPVVLMEQPQATPITAVMQQQQPVAVPPPVQSPPSREPAPVPMPPIHVHVTQPQPNRGPPFRGNMGGRGGFRPGRGRGFSTQGPRRALSQNQLTGIPDEELLCWGCDQRGHRHSDCPTNPWVGPAREWQ